MARALIAVVSVLLVGAAAVFIWGMLTPMVCPAVPVYQSIDGPTTPCADSLSPLSVLAVIAAWLTVKSLAAGASFLWRHAAFQSGQ